MTETMLYKYPATTGQRVDVDFSTFDYTIVLDEDVDAAVKSGWFKSFVDAKATHEAEAQKAATGKGK